MSTPEVRRVKFDEYASDHSLLHAAEQAHKRNYKDFLIVDVDSHHYENENYREVFEYIQNPVIKRGALDLGIHVRWREHGWDFFGIP